MATLRFPSLTIANGETESNIIGGYLFDNIKGLTVFGPAAVAGVVVVEIADTEPGVAVDADFVTLQSSGADVGVTVGDGTPITYSAFRSLRVATTVAPGAAGEVYRVVAEEKEVGSIYR